MSNSKATKHVEKCYLNNVDAFAVIRQRIREDRQLQKSTLHTA